MAHTHSRSCGPKCSGGGNQEIWLPPRAQADRSRSVATQTDDPDLQIELLDSEVLQVEQVFNRLIHKYEGQVRSYDDFQREAIERYAEIGLNVDVLWHEVVGTQMRQPTIRFLSRIEGKTFDHERQAWEVQHDILGIDDNPGVLDPHTGTVKSASKSIGFIDKG